MPVGSLVKLNWCLFHCSHPRPSVFGLRDKLGVVIYRREKDRYCDVLFENKIVKIWNWELGAANESR